MLQVTSGNLKVLSSGLVHLLAEDGGVFSLGDLTINISFIDDGTTPKINGENENEKTIKLAFHNFTQTLGQGNIKPIEIGKRASGKKIFLVFRIFSLKEKNIRTFEYTFYEEA